MFHVLQKPAVKPLAGLVLNSELKLRRGRSFNSNTT